MSWRVLWKAMGGRSSLTLVSFLVTMAAVGTVAESLAAAVPASLPFHAGIEGERCSRTGLCGGPVSIVLTALPVLLMEWTKLAMAYGWFCAGFGQRVTPPSSTPALACLC